MAVLKPMLKLALLPLLLLLILAQWMALLYKLEQHTIELVKLSRQIVELSREMEAKWRQQTQPYDNY